MEITGEMRQKMLIEETRKFLEENRTEVVKRVEKRIREELAKGGEHGKAKETAE